MTSNEEKSWKKKIQKAWDNHWTGTVNSFISDDGTNHYPILRKEIDKIITKTIHSLLHSQKERVVEMCEEMRREPGTYSNQCEYCGIHPETGGDCGCPQTMYFNKALSDLKTKIEEEL